MKIISILTNIYRRNADIMKGGRDITKLVNEFFSGKTLLKMLPTLGSKTFQVVERGASLEQNTEKGIIDL